MRKSRIQLQRDLFRPSKLSFLVRCWGMTVLNAELKSLNSILHTFSIQMGECYMEASTDGIIGGAVGSICELQGV